MLRVTEGPFFSEVAAYYEHVHQVVRLYNLPGTPAEEEGRQEVRAQGCDMRSLPPGPCRDSHSDPWSSEAGMMLNWFSGCKGGPGRNAGGAWAWAQPVQLPPAVAQPHTPPLSLCPGVEGLSLDLSSLVDIRDYVNKELALRIRTDIDSQATFFTDLNGFQVTGGPGPGDPVEQNSDWVLLPEVGGTGVRSGGVPALMEKRNQARVAREGPLQTGDPLGPTSAPECP